MNTNGKVIPNRFYRHPESRHPESRHTVSLFSSYVPEGYELVTEGFTISWSDGTYGTGRKAFTTEAEGNAYLNKCPPGFRGMSSMGD